MNQVYLCIIILLVLVVIYLQYARYLERTMDFDINQANKTRKQTNVRNSKPVLDDHNQIMNGVKMETFDRPVQTYENNLDDRSDELDENVSRLVQQGKDLQAVKLIRDQTGKTLGQSLAYLTKFKRL